MNEVIVVRGEGLSLDLLLWRKHGVRGRELVEAALALNPGLAGLGPYLPLGTAVTLPPLPTKTRLAAKLVTLFPPKASR